MHPKDQSEGYGPAEGIQSPPAELSGGFGKEDGAGGSWEQMGAGVSRGQLSSWDCILIGGRRHRIFTQGNDMI